MNVPLVGQFLLAVVLSTTAACAVFDPLEPHTLKGFFSTATPRLHDQWSELALARRSR
jgi:hypothetical protein